VVRYLSSDGVGYLVTDPDLARWVLVDGAGRFGKQTPIDERFKRVIGHGIFTREGEDWRFRRRLMSPYLSRRSVDAQTDLIAAAIDTMIDRWDGVTDDAAAIDVAAEMGALSLDVTCRVLFGVALGDRSVSLAKAPADALLLLTRSERPALIEARQAVTDLVQEIVAYGRSAHGDDTLLRALLTLPDPNTGSPLGEEDVEAEVTGLLLAGFETTSGALAWTWSLLSQHPAVAADVESAASGPGSPEATATIRSVLLEAMRLFPPAWIVGRSALKEEALGERTVTAGSQVAVSPYAMHRHSNLWTDPDTFAPDRFSDGPPPRTHPLAYLPFGAGPRRCIGENLAMIEAMLVISKVAARYHLRLAPGHVVQADPQFTLRPRGGLPMIITRIGRH
jgi:cytochrome P450